jgi:hypothetical protein
LAAAVFSVMPCNYFAYKVVAVFLLTLSLFLLQQVIRLFNPSNEWGWGFALLNPFFLILFLQLEKFQFAIPFLMLALYFYAKSKLLKENYFLSVNKTVASLLVLCSLGFWTGGLILAIPFSLGSFFALLLSGAAGVYGFLTYQISFGSLLNFGVTENIPLIGVLVNVILLVGWKKIPKELKYETLIVGLMALVNSKFALLLTPFLVLGFIQYLQDFKVKTPNFQAFTNAMPWACLIGVLLAMPTLYPGLDLRETIQEARVYSLKENLPITNEWSHGYIMINEGVPTESFGGVQTFEDYNNSIALVSFGNPAVSSCEQLTKGKYELFKCGGKT